MGPRAGPLDDRRGPGAAREAKEDDVEESCPADVRFTRPPLRAGRGARTMKAMILCGGRGTRLREHTETLPKPLVEIGGRPILWHIMKSYAAHGITDFILCLGYKGHLIKDYFLNYEALSMDFSICLGKPDSIQYHGASHREDGWNITLVDTGQDAMTGARVKRASRYLGAEDTTFALTYGDGVSNVDLQACLEFHHEHGRHATVTGVQPAGRFGELQTDQDRVTAFTEKPQAASRLINGGFFFLNRVFLDYLSEDDDCILERDPLEQCASDGQLHVYEHAGYWQCMDTNRDWESLEREWAAGHPPWKVWE